MVKLSQFKHRGSALTECCTLMAAMVPLMFGIPMIGKLIDLKQASVQASRYSAWETTVGQQSAPVNVNARFFSDASAGIHSAATNPDSHALWGEDASFTGTGRFALDTRVEIDESNASAARSHNHPISGGKVADLTAGLISGAGNALDGLTGGRWKLEDRGTIQSNVQVEVAANGWLGRSSIKQHTVIMSDGWSAADDDQAGKRVRSFVPGGLLDHIGVGKVLSVVGYLPLFKELKPLDNAFGHVDMLPLPESEKGVRMPLPYQEDR